MATILKQYGNASPLSPLDMNMIQDDYESYFSSWKDLVEIRRGIINTTGTTVTNMLLNTGVGTDRVVPGSTAASYATGRVFYLDPADYAAGSRTRQLMVVAEIIGGVGVGASVSLFPVTGFGTTTGTPAHISTLGSALGMVFVPTSVDTGVISGSPFTMPSAGLFVLAASTSVANATPLMIGARLMMRQV